MYNETLKTGYSRPDCSLLDLQSDLEMLQASQPDLTIDDWVEGDDEMF